MVVITCCSLVDLDCRCICIFVPRGRSTEKDTNSRREKHELRNSFKNFNWFPKNAFIPAGIIFFATGVSGGIFFFKLAQQWAEILKAFEKVENIFQSEIYENNSSGWSLKRRIRVTSAVFLVLALSEHLAAWSSFLYDRLIQIKLCKWQIGSMFYYLATTHLHHVYAELPVKLMTVAWAEYMNVSLTFVWSYIDLFIIIVSIGVSSKFHKINKRLECFRERVSKGQNTKLSF